MGLLLFVWFVLPFLLFYLVLKLMRKYAPDTVPVDVRALCLADPIEKRWYRVLRRDAAGLMKLADCEKQDEAVEKAYLGKEQAEAAKSGATFLVLNDKGEVLQQIDARL